MSTRVTAASGATPRQRTRRNIGNTNRQTIDDGTLRVPRPPPPRLQIQEERRTVELMHKPNGDPNVFNASPRKKERDVSKPEPAAVLQKAGTAKEPMPSSDYAKAATVTDDATIGLQQQMQPYDASGNAGLSAHAEYSLGIMREFFKRRPLQALKDAFFRMDTDCSGKLDEQEFIQAMQILNIDVTVKDSSAMFRAVDFDSSGSLNFDEFFRSFRTDAFKRSDFFWGKVRAGALGWRPWTWLRAARPADPRLPFSTRRRRGRSRRWDPRSARR